MFSTTKTDLSTFSTGSGFWFYYSLNSTEAKRPNDATKTVSTGQNQTLGINLGSLSSLLDSNRTINNAFTIANKTNQPLNLELSIQNVSSPTLALVGIDYILNVTNQNVSAKSTNSIAIKAQFLPLLKIGGRYTGLLTIKDKTNDIQFSVPIEVTIVLL